MLFLLNFVLTLAAVVVIVPAALLVLELLVGLPRRGIVLTKPGPFGKTIALMPAHNEATGIAGTIAGLQSQLSDRVRLLVVADNCTDDTAALARAAGAEVIERRDTSARGKGYALDFGIRHLATDPPEVVIVLDADCEVAPGGIEGLTRAALKHQRPIQAQYLLEPHPDACLGQSIATFAFRLKNYNRPMGLMRLGAPCPLTGSGMAFPWQLIAGAHLSSANIVEDMKLGIDLTRAGTPPMFLPDVLVTSPFPRTDEARQTQQQRWEHGHLAMMRGEAIPLLQHGLATRDWRAAVAAVDLMIPPLTLLLGLLGAGLIASALLALLGFASGPFAVFLFAMLAVIASIALTWHVYGRTDMPPAALATVPEFALAKLKVYSTFVLGRRSGWIRTDRS